MKKTSYILLALAVVLGLTQCKKDKVDNVAPELQGEKYTIALNLGGETDAKADIYPFDGNDIAPVYYTVGDIIQVAYKGVRVGELICTSSTIPSNPANYGEAASTFKGDLTVDPAVVDGTSPLYFYFIGNQPYGTTSGKLIVDISDQTDQLPVISYAASLEPFAEGRETYSVQYNWLLNQCALVKFEAENLYDMSANTLDNNPYALYKTTKEATLFGMDNQVEIDLSDNTFTWSQENNGALKPYRHSSDTDGSVRYAIIHHGNYTSLTAGELDVPFDPATDPYGFYGTYKIGTNVAQNAYFDGGKLHLVWHSGAFTTSDNEGATTYQVVFSRGNVQYAANASATGTTRAANTWRLAKHQYDYVGGGTLLTNTTYCGNVVYDEDDATSPAMNHNNGANMSDNEKKADPTNYGWIDLYGWGTGDRPLVVTNDNSLSNGHPYDMAKFVDWGNNYIVNSGKPNDNTFWQTLTHDEWEWVIDYRGGETNATDKNGLGTVNGVKGLILLPDNWAGMPSGVSVTWIPSKDQPAEVIGIGGVNWTSMSFSETEWQKMEQAGAVFMPAAGYLGHTLSTSYNNVEWDGGSGTGGRNQDHGAYWSRTPLDNNTSSWTLRFGNASYYAGSGWPSHWVNPRIMMDPANGHAVRLVHKLSNRFGL